MHGRHYSLVPGGVKRLVRKRDGVLKACAMNDSIERMNAQLEQARRERDARAVQLRKRGRTLKEIAQEIGVTYQRVQQILEREQA